MVSITLQSFGLIYDHTVIFHLAIMINSYGMVIGVHAHMCKLLLFGLPMTTKLPSGYFLTGSNQGLIKPTSVAQ